MTNSNNPCLIEMETKEEREDENCISNRASVGIMRSKRGKFFSNFWPKGILFPQHELIIPQRLKSHFIVHVEKQWMTFSHVNYWLIFNCDEKPSELNVMVD